ncbi:hypothetical protein SARC_02232 [Sphaeroforma arctica JP610]|uniref:Polysaccharide lyase 14 domain-containing protein n=1 Tax=Sphaeroforma arctica JP610 TaxID=667725 RepID=A0A0L0G9R7_9EUKA|nr:hypothetical protein SARC_02232 [Sphaeroforma arctica JP610]KNC85611.1 hypothetical protein SARC_02232 [Sphaeroforma arctica JP610]|eukprot:XP_014159513.1 hypothetical protein SARC_02232 [Sphaeroforma arctica JP610]
MILKSLFLLASVTLGVIDSVVAVPHRRSNVVSSVPNFNDYSIGDAPDIYKLFSSPFSGCFGMYRDGTDCVAEKPNDSYIRQDPVSSSGTVMEINLRKGVYGTDDEGTGGQYYTEEFSSSEFSDLTDATYEYEVYFPSTFEWTLGGKLPGMYGGSFDCSGGYKADGDDCFSTRLMWRENGEGEAYMYIPMTEQDDSFCAKCAYPVMENGCESVSTCSLSRGAFSFQRGKFNKVKQYVKLNAVGENDGEFQLWINGAKVISESLTYRTSEKLKLGGSFFSVFFGGSGNQYAPDNDNTILFKGFELTAGLA